MRTAVFASLAVTVLATAPTRGDVLTIVTSGGDVDESVAGMAKITKEEMDTQSSANSPLQIPNLGVGTAQLTNGVSVYTDVPMAEWHDVPEWMEFKLDMVVTSTVVTTQYPFFFQCFPKTGEVCDLYAFAYPCLDCPDYEHGDFIKSLVADGWEVFRCTPSVVFTWTQAQFPHKMLGLRKTVSKGTKLLRYLDAPSEFFSFGIDYEPEVCDSIATEDKCNTMTKGKCMWDNGECVFNTCKPGGLYGPGVCTTHCITLELPHP